jgi:hypothetical protein
MTILKSGNLCEPPPMPLLPDDPCAQAQDVHVVVLDALASRIGVMAHTGADTGNLVSRYCHANTATADQQSTFTTTTYDLSSDGGRVVGIVIRLGRVMRA